MRKICIDKRRADASLIRQHGIDEILLMENAASNMAHFINGRLCPHSRVVFVIGGGNNGADGMACARILQSLASNDVHTLLLCSQDEAESYLKSPLAKKHFDILRSLECSLIFSSDILLSLGRDDIVVDCLFGSGYKSRGKLPVSEKFLRDFEECRAMKVACDVPSMTPEKYGLRVDVTLCMGAPSIECLDKERTKAIKVLPIGVPARAYASDTNTFLIDKQLAFIHDRRAQSVHKGDFGNAYIVCGKMAGAGMLSAKAALIAGAGKVILYTGLESSALQDPEIICSDSIESAASLGIPNHSERSRGERALGVGMGLGLSEDKMERLYELLTSWGKNIVFDADILHKKGLISLLRGGGISNCILTPHVKELLAFARNLDSSPIDKLLRDFDFNMSRLSELTRAVSMEIPEAVFIVKDSNMLIAKNGTLVINPYAKSNLAKAGSGDVLSGVATSLLAQGFDPVRAAECASLLLSLCSNVALKKYASFGLTPKKILKILRSLKHNDLERLDFVSLS